MLTSRCIVIRCRSASYICVIATKSVTQTLCKQIVQNNETSLKAKWSNTNWTCVLHFTCFPRDLSVRKLGFPRSISWPQNLVGNHGGGPLLFLVAACHRPCRSCSTLYPLSSTTQRQHQVHTKGQRQRQKTRSGSHKRTKTETNKVRTVHHMTWHDTVTRSELELLEESHKILCVPKSGEKIPISRKMIPISGKNANIKRNYPNIGKKIAIWRKKWITQMGEHR